jgi:hypothetical protein
MRAALDVYVEDRRTFLNSTYILRLIVDQVVRQGVSVRILDRLDPASEATAAFVHIDLTTVPAPFTWVNGFYARCLNGRSISIARDIYSMARLLPGDDFLGPVIVKTLLNHRGLPEFIHAAAERRLGGEFKALQDIVCPKYRIFASIQDIPDSVWSNSGLIVERFVPGTLDLPIVKHRHDFMLDLELNTRAEFNDLLCAQDSLIRLDFIDGVPQEVHDVRRQLKLDFGSIDFFVVDGRVTVIDVNKTTTFTPQWLKAHRELRTYFDALATRLRSFVTFS